MARRPQPVEFSMEYQGKTYNASYYLQGGMITVQTAGGHKSTQLGGLRLKVLARMLLGQLIRTGKAAPNSIGVPRGPRPGLPTTTRLYRTEPRESVRASGWPPKSADIQSSPAEDEPGDAFG